ncbi:MAG: hypothetical protein ACR2IJ_10000 [Fluviibacter sp.]
MTNYVEVNADNQIITYPYTFSSLQTENPYTNFGDNQDVMYWFPQTNAATELGYQLFPVLETPAPPYDPLTQYVVPGSPAETDGQWYTTWTVVTYTPEQQVYQDNLRKQANKQQASQLLSATDWTSIPSVADPAQSNPYLANQNAFFEYRNQLRQIAVNPPVVVDPWPTEPDEVWETAP